jgi:cytochrome c peroxidase
MVTATVLWTTALAGGTGARTGATQAAQTAAPMMVFGDTFGQLGTFSVAGAVDTSNPFFQDLGTNGRTCASCHRPESAWTLTPAVIEASFRATRGNDPVFSNNDGSNCEGAVTQTLAEKRSAYSLLLTRGLFRVGMEVPANADFVIDSISDPFQCGAPLTSVSMYRRPLPAANLAFLSAVMWDGRESQPTTTIFQDLMHQANDATRGHAQSVRDLTPEEQAQIARFESSMFAAQLRDKLAGPLARAGATGGPIALATQPFFIGINDPVGLNPTGAVFDSNIFTIFDPWLSLDGDSGDTTTEARLAIARGERVFNTKPIAITGVGGLNGQTFASGVRVGDSLVGTCGTCHDSPNAGTHSVKAPLDIGVADPANAPYLPVYTLRNVLTGDTTRTTDPGRAMISGRWEDVGHFKGPVLRALAARAPYFHNGSAATLDEVLDFYERRFRIGLTPQERADLLAFLRAL